MKKLFTMFASLVAAALAGHTATAGGFGSHGYGSSGYSVGYGSSGYSAAYGSSGSSAAYGSSGYSAAYGSSGYTASYGSSGYTASYGSSGHAAARPGLLSRIAARHQRRHAAHGSSGYSASYGSSGYSASYGSSGYSAGYGSSGYSAGYGSSGYSAGYGSSGYSTGYGSSGYTTSYGSSGTSVGYGSSGNSAGFGSNDYSANTSIGSSYQGYAVQSASSAPTVQGPFEAPSGYRWVQRSSAVGSSSTAGSSSGMTNGYPVQRASGLPTVEGPFPAPAGYRWVRRPRTVNPAPNAKDAGAIQSSDHDVELVSTSFDSASDEVQLTVKATESARIFVNGNATSSTGEVRQFVSRGLTPGQEYRFDIRVEDMINGQEVVETKTVVAVPGNGEVVIFDLNAPSNPIETVLTLNVPADAHVVLAGNTTKSAGSNRTFRTSELKIGQVWDDYIISVTSNGVTKEKKVRLIGGDDIELSFNFDDQSQLVASK